MESGLNLEDEADNYAKKPGIHVELQIVALLEFAISKLLQRQEDEILDLVSKAKEMCKSVSGDNSSFLEGHCLYIQSRWHRYQKNDTQALEFAQQAMVKLYGAESGVGTIRPLLTTATPVPYWRKKRMKLRAP